MNIVEEIKDFYDERNQGFSMANQTLPDDRRIHTLICRCTSCQSSGLFPLYPCSRLADAVCVPFSQALQELAEAGVTTISVPPGRCALSFSCKSKEIAYILLSVTMQTTCMYMRNIILLTTYQNSHFVKFTRHK